MVPKRLTRVELLWSDGCRCIRRTDACSYHYWPDGFWLTYGTRQGLFPPKTHPVQWLYQHLERSSYCPKYQLTTERPVAKASGLRVWTGFDRGHRTPCKHEKWETVWPVRWLTWVFWKELWGGSANEWHKLGEGQRFLVLGTKCGKSTFKEDSKWRALSSNARADGHCNVLLTGSSVPVPFLKPRPTESLPHSNFPKLRLWPGQSPDQDSPVHTAMLR